VCVSTHVVHILYRRDGSRRISTGKGRTENVSGDDKTGFRRAHDPNSFTSAGARLFAADGWSYFLFAAADRYSSVTTDRASERERETTRTRTTITRGPPKARESVVAATVVHAHVVRAAAVAVAAGAVSRSRVPTKPFFLLRFRSVGFPNRAK